MLHELTADDKSKRKAGGLALHRDKRKEHSGQNVTREEKWVSADDQLDALHPGGGFDATSTIQPRHGAFRLLSVFAFAAASLGHNLPFK
ncbi:hypothetical protein TNCV_93621 [Trichonephila clavipes]|nr:hypothetical protein TNCV_93621 [Trichonephila clavipes]